MKSIPTELNEAGMTWNQRKNFHDLVDSGLTETKAYHYTMMLPE